MHLFYCRTTYRSAYKSDTIETKTGDEMYEEMPKDYIIDDVQREKKKIINKKINDDKFSENITHDNIVDMIEKVFFYPLYSSLCGILYILQIKS